MKKVNDYTINISDEQWKDFWASLHVGTPIQVALSFAGIKTATYYQAVKLWSVVEYCNALDEIGDKRDTEDAMSMNQHEWHSNIAVAAYKEPEKELVERYKKDDDFKKYANGIHDRMDKANKMRSEIVIYHLQRIRDGAAQRGKNTNASQWFLERTMPEFFGRTDRNDPGKETPITAVKSITVEYVDPNKKDDIDRVNAMEEELLKEYGGESKA